MSETSMLSVKPIIHYPRVAQVGKTYLMTIDLQPEDDFEWLQDEEDYSIYCKIDSELFISKPIDEPVIVLHRFGGSYGASKFLLSATLQKIGQINIIFENSWGVQIKVIQLKDIEVRVAQTKSNETFEHVQSEIIKTTFNNFSTNPSDFAQEIPAVQNQSWIERLSKTASSFLDDIFQRDGSLNNVITRTTKRLGYGSFDDWYLQCQAWDCQTYRPEGMTAHDGIFTPLLGEVFVPLGLDLNATMPGFKMSSKNLRITDLQQTQVLSIWQFLRAAEQNRPFRQLALLAWGGYGKTTLLKHVTYIYSTKQYRQFQVPKRIPVLLVLRKYGDLLAQENPPTLPELITYHHIPNLPKEGNERPIPENWATNLLRQGNAVVMLDGFDEISIDQRHAVSYWINQQMHRYAKPIFIVTSRPKAYKEQDVIDRLELPTTVWIRDFNADQRRDFVSRWYQCQEKYAHGGRDTPYVKQLAANSANDLLSQIEARQELKALSKNPLLLNMIVHFHRRYPGSSLPKRKVDFYREICSLQLRDRPRALRLDTILTQYDVQAILQKLALQMMEERRERLTNSAVIKRLAAYLQQQGRITDARELLEQVVQVSELLVEQEDEVEFAHLSFQEYLAAAEIAHTQQERKLYEHFGDDWWKPTILLYAGLVNPTRLMRTMLRLGANDLAYACWQESSKQIDPIVLSELDGIQQSIANSRYQKLEDHLRNGQWREADKDTYRLMITSIGKEEGQIFEPEELQNFPCDELEAIDRLWISYSSGKFGFSIQKQIYVECGAKLDGVYPGNDVWNNFCERVDWINENPSDKSEILYDLTTLPEGHLPRNLFVLSGEGAERNLYSRLASCKI